MKNTSIPGLNYRKTAPDLLVNTVFGTETVNVKHCSCCMKVLPLSAFYLEPNSLIKTRGMCVVCHNKDTTQRSKERKYHKRKRYSPDTKIETLI